MSANTTSRRSINRRQRSDVINLGIGAGIVVAVAVFLEWKTGLFFALGNLENILHHNAALALLALGLTFVFVAGNFDLGLGNLNGLMGIIAATLIIKEGWGGWGAVVATVLIAVVLNAAFGALIGYRGYNSIAVTLASANVYIGLTFVLSEGRPIRGDLPEGFRAVFGTGATLGLSNAIWIVIVLYACGYFVLSRMTFGHYLYAIGGNVTATRASGVRTSLLVAVTFAVSGALAGIAATMNTAWIGSGQPLLGPGFTLPMFAAVFFGVALGRGRATVAGTLLGVLLIGVISNGTTLLGSREFVNQVLIGGLLLFSVLLGRWEQAYLWWQTRRSAHSETASSQVLP